MNPATSARATAKLSCGSPGPRSPPTVSAIRARLVLDCADVGVAEAARRSGVSPTTVSKWWRRYSEFGIDGLSDTARTGRPTASTETVAGVLRCALLTPPADGNRWSTHAIAEHTGTSQATVSRIRRRVFPRSDPGTELLPDSATTVLAYVDVDVAGCAIGLMPARGGAARNSPALADAVETIVCAALIRRPHDGYRPPEPRVPGRMVRRTRRPGRERWTCSEGPLIDCRPPCHTPC